MNTPLALIDVTNRKEKQFNTKNIHSIEELCEFLPIGYRDYSKISHIKDIKEDEWVSVYGEVINKIETSKVFSIIIKDCNNNTLRINWFTNYNYDQIDIKEKYVFCGKISSYKNELCMNVPEAYSYGNEICKIMPRYSTIRGMAATYLTTKIHMALQYTKKHPKPIDRERETIAKSFGLQNRLSALMEIHNPSTRQSFKLAKSRLNFDIIYDFYKNLEKRELYYKRLSPVKLKSFTQTGIFIKSLPFELTAGQISALKKLRETLLRGKRLNSLLLGDVGSGKTVCAASVAVSFCENNYQVAMLSPTQVLAMQNYNVIKDYLEPMGYKVALLIADLKSKEKKKILKDVLDGKIDVLIGTHSVLSDNVEFNNLGLTIIDEEHRFGVLQKKAMAKKVAEGVSNLSMSATPIPRSLGLFIYGNSIDIIIIDTMPKGRIPVITTQESDIKNTFNLIKSEISKGRQCYIICPLIEDSESELLAEVDSVDSTFDEVSDYFKNNQNIKIGRISGKMKGSEIEEVLDKFSSNEINILISTTIVEVGVNMPNASVMLIKNAERFGLAQIHQLRGRVGRGRHQSYCCLISTYDKERLDILCKTTDGFKIAEEDLRLRGAGKLFGISQTGHSEDITTILSHPKLAKATLEKIKIYKKKNSKTAV